MMKLKAFGSICILAFVLFATVSAANNTTTTAPPPSAATTSLSSLPATTAAPPPSATTTAPAPSATTTTPPPSATTTAPPTTPEPSKDEVVTTKQSRIDCKARITSVEFEDVKDLTSENGTKFKKEFEEKMLGVLKQKNKLVISVKVTGVSPGSVIVEYYLVLNTTSEAEAAKIANAVTEAIKSGKIGNYTTDQNFETDAYIIRKVKASDVSTAPTSTTTTVSTALLIVLGAALFILLVIIIILIVLVVFLLKLKEKREKH